MNGSIFGQDLTKDTIQSITWLSVDKRGHQCITSIAFNFVDVFPCYLVVVFMYTSQSRIELRTNFVNLKVPFQKTKIWQTSVLQVGSFLWVTLPEAAEKTTDLSTFKYNLKRQYLSNLTRTQVCWCSFKSFTTLSFQSTYFFIHLVILFHVYGFLL